MWMRSVSAAAVVLALAGCGGEGGGTSDEQGQTPPVASAETPVTSKGTITGFGSVFVNGHKFEILESTLVFIEGQNGVGGGQSLLKLGQKVRIEAKALGDGTFEASSVTFDEDLRGPAVQVTPGDDPAYGTFKVLGQTVTVDALTVLGDDFEDLNGDGEIDIRDLDNTISPSGAIIVEVSGSVTETGFIATRIDPVDEDAVGNPDIDGDEVEVKGFVDEVIDGGLAIVINEARFEITGSTEFEDGLVADDSLLGLFVEVKADIDGNGDYIARSIELGEEDEDEAEGTELEIEGVLQSVDISGTPHVIVIDGETIEVVDASELQGFVGQRIEIEGTVNADGVLELDEIEVERAKTVEIRDEVASVDEAAGTFTTRLGLVIEPTGESRVFDLVNPQGGPIVTPAEFLSRLEAQDDIVARGYPDENGDVVWSQVKRERVEREGCSLRAPVGADISAGVSFTLRGVTVETSGITDDDRFMGEDGAPIGSAAFYDALAQGDIVKASSGGVEESCADGMLTVTDAGYVAFEPEDDVEANDDDRGEAGEGEEGEAGDVIGAIRAVDDVNLTVTVAERSIPVLPGTVIDGELIAAAKQSDPETEPDAAFGDLGLTLEALLPVGTVVDIELDASGNAEEIELRD